MFNVHLIHGLTVQADCNALRIVANIAQLFRCSIATNRLDINLAEDAAVAVNLANRISFGN